LIRAGCRLWTHYDISDNFLVHVGPGTKRVILFAPTDSPCLYAATTSSSVLDLDQPDLQRYPHFAHARPLECILQPGDVLFIPALWWHNVETISFCTSVNFFWHAEPEHWYDQTDVYGSKDLRLAQHAMAAAHACKTALNALPSSYYVDFYRIRAMEVIEAAACVSEQSNECEATTTRALDVDHDHA
jgi:tRNA wybutosine-synthesizing protein 5